MSKTENLPESNANEADLDIRSLQIGDDPTPFRDLNVEWLSQFFALEDKDKLVLGNPDKHILQKGGRIFMLYANNEPIGCVALIPLTDDAIELGKMTITTRLRGLGLGRKLLEYAIAQARATGASYVLLGSNKRLQNAIHLYEIIGFQYIDAEEILRPPYARENVLMKLTL